MKQQMMGISQCIKQAPDKPVYKRIPRLHIMSWDYVPDLRTPYSLGKATVGEGEHWYASVKNLSFGVRPSKLENKATRSSMFETCLDANEESERD